MAGNLTRDEAKERARILSVDSYAVELDLTTGDETFRSTTVVRFSSTEPGARTFVDLAAPSVRSAVLNGRELDPAELFDGERLVLPEVAAENELTVVADAAYMRTGEGLHRFVDPVDGSVYLYSQFETADAHRMFTCFDQPDLKAAFELTVYAPPSWEVVSNSAPDVEREAAGEERVRWHFPATQVMSTYITALIAGPYHVVRDEHDGIPLGLYCRASLADHLDADALFEVTKQGFDFFHGLFDLRYPFGKYDQLFVPEFNAGAMENAGAVTFLEDYVFRSRVTDARYERRAETILHEMAHMWFGDLVTMRWWDDLWLNESFATYASVYCQVNATQWSDAWTTFANVEKAWALRQDQLPSTHPIAADMVDIQAVEVNFDGITYAKGASVLKQLAAYVGVDAFFAGVRAYFKENAFGNTELKDLLKHLEAASGRDLSDWSREWLETTGVNTMRPEFEVDANGDFTSFAILQEAVDDLLTHRDPGAADRLDRLSRGRRPPQRLEVRSPIVSRRHLVERGCQGSVHGPGEVSVRDARATVGDHAAGAGEQVSCDHAHRPGHRRERDEPDRNGQGPARQGPRHRQGAQDEEQEDRQPDPGVRPLGGGHVAGRGVDAGSAGHTEASLDGVDDLGDDVEERPGGGAQGRAREEGVHDLMVSPRPGCGPPPCRGGGPLHGGGSGQRPSTVRTILPVVRPVSPSAWALAASARGNASSTWARRPFSTSSAIALMPAWSASTSIGVARTPCWAARSTTSPCLSMRI